MFGVALLPRAIAAVIGAASIGSAIGYVLSGILVDAFSAVAVFWFLFALPVVLSVAVVAFVPESSRSRVPVDVLGAVLLGLGLVALLLGISKGRDWGWASAAIVGLFATAVALLACFVFVERRVRQPLVDLRLVVTRPFAQANACVSVMAFSFFIPAFLVPSIAAAPEATGYGSGLSTMRVGLVLFPTGIATLAGAWAAGRLVDRVGPRALVAAARCSALQATSRSSSLTTRRSRSRSARRSWASPGGRSSPRSRPSSSGAPVRARRAWPPRSTS
jgi:MFS family permease